jgi:hypothetical protein
MSPKSRSIQKMDVHNFDIGNSIDPKNPPLVRPKPTALSQIRRLMVKLSLFGVGRIEFETTHTTFQQRESNDDERI